ncbi:sodium:proton antiporter [Anaeromyxobacter diazotrophicus]|uniref:Multicomponent Na+:H+ antiporter subunit C n=1 Tax=Anaeromyxobacter diazotrophicus TaxID=2590199 RepID=A0A7I9VG70_9BACT|nr:cation:proton antiporter subunit C [Anaeromyxobacter diazotrophicus]GEJ55394.1 hypothetical protein AMYX_01350 [Anaeromyxobacter diazotrophicus]
MTLAGAAGALPWAAAAWLLLCGVWGVATSKNLVHLVVCLSVVQSSTYLVLLGVGWRRGGAAPLTLPSDGYPPPGAPLVDPIVQALMLTDVVVGATVTALLLALVVKAHAAAHSLHPDRLTRLRG